MALTSYYIIQDATNRQYYTEDHDVPLSDRWTDVIQNAHMYASRGTAETELDADDFSSTEFRIVEVIIKS
jgi:hypothetical protein